MSALGMIDDVGDALEHVDAILKLVDDGIDAGTDSVVLMAAVDAARLRLKAARSIVDALEAQPEFAQQREAAAQIVAGATGAKKRARPPLAHRKTVRR